MAEVDDGAADVVVEVVDDSTVAVVSVELLEVGRVVDG